MLARPKTVTFLALLIIISIISTCSGAIGPITALASTSLFDDGFESGNLASWSGTSGSPTVVSSTVHHGSYALRCDSSGELVYKTGLLGYSTVYTRFYVQINALPASGQSVKIAKATNTRLSPIWELYFTRSEAGTLQIRFKSSVPSTRDQTQRFDYAINTWYCFEVKYSQSADGEYRVWLDGVEIISRTGVDTSGRGFGRLELGIQWASYAVTTHHDCVAISETYIGQESAEQDYVLGDVNHDGTVNVLDFSILGYAYGSHPGDEAWNPDADLNNDEVINILDLCIIAPYLSESPEQPSPSFKDDFSGDLNKWEIIDGNWYIEDGKLRCDVVSRREKIVFNEDVGDNYEITCKVYIISYGSGPEGQIITRYEDSNNFYFMGLGTYGYKGAIGTYDSGRSSMLVSGGNSGYVDVQAGVWYEQKVVVVENSLTVFINGKEICSTTDTSHLTGRVGLTCIYSSVYFDDFTIKKLSPSSVEPSVEPPQSGMIVGVDIWWGMTRTQFLSDHLVKMKECGVRMVRINFGELRYMSNFRSLVPAIVENGIDVLGLLIRTDLVRSNNVDAWGDWVYSVVSEFKDDVKVWEIWNEPNLNQFFEGKDPVKYTNFLKRGYTEAKRADPSCFVLGGSVVFTHNTALNFLRTIYDNGGGDYMDALSYHPYCNPYAPDDTRSTPNPYIYLTRVRDVMVDYGEQDKMIWLTEVGWTTNDDGQVGDEKQAQYLVQALEMAKDWGWVEAFIIYNWKDSNTSGKLTKGLLQTDLSRKSSFYAVKDFING